MKSAFIKSIVVALLMLSSLCRSADSYPNRPVNFIVPFGPGGNNDVVARIFANQLSEQLGKTVIVQNKLGASGVIGADFVAKAPPDGYTILMFTISMATMPGVMKSLPFDLVTDFTPITELVRLTNVLAVHPSLKVNTVKEFISLAQANPGKFNYGSAGNGSSVHLSTELFNSVVKIDLAHIPYKGGTIAAAHALLSNEVQMVLASVATLGPFIRNGQFRALAVTTNGKRTPLLPDIPSMDEAGIPGMGMYVWLGLSGPPKMPRDIVNKLNAESRKALAVPSVRARLSADGSEVVGGSPEEFGSLVRAEIQRWTSAAKAAGIKPE